jgi:APA family basic amino acid/polyamine antiporter
VSTGLAERAAPSPVADAAALPATANLHRSLGLVAATCLIVGQVIGIGIFLTPAEMARDLGSSGLVYSMWLLAGLMALAGALCYGELASRFPEAGGAYVYLRRAWGEPVAFLYGWKCLLVMDPGLSAALAAGLAQYVAYLTPMSAVERKALAIGTILILAGLTALGTRLATGAVVAVTIVKVAILGTIVILGLTDGGGDTTSLLPSLDRYPSAPALVPALAGGFIAAFFSFGGWWEAARMAGEVRDPQRTLPRAFVLAIAVVTLLYVVTSAVFMRLVPLAEAGQSGAFAARVGERLFGAAGGTVFAAAVAVCVLGSLAAFVLSSPRLYLALARDGLFPARLGQLHPRFGTPVTAIAVQAVLASLLVVVGTFSDIVAYFIFVTILFIAASVGGIYRLPAPPATAFRTPGRRFMPAFFVALCAVVLTLLLIGRPLQATLGLLVVALGVPAYVALRRTGSLTTKEIA